MDDLHSDGTKPGPRAGQAERSVAARLALNGILAAASIVAALTLLEVALRVYHGALFDISSQLDPLPNRAATPLADYDPRLGWVPKTGTFDRSATEKWKIDEAGLRSNGSTTPQSDRPIVAVGDSYTFGDEVLDDETWPARLQLKLGLPVINGGVFAYGIDQAVLRAERLIDTRHPAVVLLAFISDDINRAELAFYNGWKPYFEWANGRLTLKNVPVPRDSLPVPRFARLRSVLSHSYLLSAVLRRAADRWWTYGRAVRARNDGERVAVELLDRLQMHTRENGASLVVIALPTAGRLGGSGRSPRIVEQSRARGIDVLDLQPLVEGMPADSLATMFRPRGHYSPPMNQRVADRIAEYLRGMH
jgi:hypothetical protein